MVSNTTITCPSPASTDSQQASVQFFLNAVPYTGESPSSFNGDGEEEDEEEEDAEEGKEADGEEPQRGHFRLEYVEDPQFFTANKEKLIKHHPGEPLTLIINVSDTEQAGRSRHSFTVTLIFFIFYFFFRQSASANVKNICFFGLGRNRRLIGLFCH